MDDKKAAEQPAPEIVSINEPPGSDVIDLSEPGTQAGPGLKDAPKPKAKADAADPDDLEEEIEDAEDDGDVSVKHGKKKTRR